MMLLFLSFLLNFIIIVNCHKNGVCESCDCVGNNLNCQNRNLTNHLNDTILETNQFDQINFDYNLIVHLKPFPVLTANKVTFRHNRITIIDDATFRSIKNLTEIDLSHNHLTSNALKPHIFMGNYSPQAYEPLLSLKILKLSSNSLHTLHADIFEHLPNLEDLHLDSNPFKLIDTPTTIAIASLMNLKVLNLSSTKISKLPPTLLHTPQYLKTLDLSNNQFEDVVVELGESHDSLETLILDNNPISQIRSFPKLNSLITLHLSNMPNLENITSGSLKNLQNLKELWVTNCPNLGRIDEDSLTGNDTDQIWPPLNKLYLNHNKLGYLGQYFLSRWDHLLELDISMNPWVCDCKNQWFLSTVIPQLLKINPVKASYVMCEEPIEMRGRYLVNLTRSSVEMRCLDTRGARPEKDAVVLVAVLIGVLTAIPLSMVMFTMYRRFYGNGSPFVRFSYQRASFIDTLS